MLNRWTLAISGLVLVVIVLIVAISRTQSATGGLAPTPTPAKAKLETPATTAEGVIVPVRRAQLAFQTGGTVAKVAVKAGDIVETGQVLIELEASELQLAVTAAEDTLALQQAMLTQAKAAARPEDVALAEAGVAAAQAGVKSAQSAVAQAQANLAKLERGPTERDMQIAQQQVDQAKNNLWSAQTDRDGMAHDFELGLVKQYQLDAANAHVAAMETALTVARLQFEKAKDGAQPEELAAARAQVGQAAGQLDAARAQVAEAQARLVKAKAGARAEDLAVSEAQVRQAQTGLEQAKMHLSHARLKAPFAGTVVAVAAREGELVNLGAPVLTLADLSELRVETTDLDEAGAATVRPGQAVKITVNAFDDKILTGKVVAIAPQGIVTPTGDTVYTVTIDLDRQDPELRWGMTTKVEFK